MARVMVVAATGVLAALTLLPLTAAAAGTSVAPGTVTLVSNVAGGSTQYTIPFMTSSSGALAALSTITFTAPNGTAFPSAVSDYSVTSSTVSGVATSAANGSATPNQVVIGLGTSTIAASTSVSVVVQFTSNPITADTTYTMDESTSSDTVVAPSPAYTVAAGPAASGSPTSGDNQSEPVNHAFSSLLAATFTDHYGNPVSGANVTFSSPASGASGTFANGTDTTTTTTNASGVATSTVFTANGTAGSYHVTARVTANGVSTSFSLTNLAAAPPTVTAGTVTLSSSTVGASGVTYTVPFTTSGTGSLGAGATISIVAPGGTAFTSCSIACSGYSIGAGSGSAVIASVAASAVNGSATLNKIVVTLGASTIAGSDLVTVTANADVMNPTVASSVYVLNESTSSDTGNATSPHYSVTPGPATKVVATSGSDQSTDIDTAFAAPLIATIEDMYGNPEGAGSLVTFTIGSSGGATAAFANTTNVETDSTGTNGEAISSTFTANDTVGSYSVTATSGILTSANFSETNTAGPATQVVATAGSGQSATVGTAFATNLSATVEDAQGNPVLIAGTSVTFTAPANGASGTFANGTATTTAMTNASGVATATVFTANATAGGAYTVTATSTGLTPANFSETNTAGAATQMVATAGSGQSATVGTAFATDLSATVEDAQGNPVLVAGTSVTFTAPPDAPSGTFANGTGTTTAMTNGSGVATATVFTANSNAGAYTVTAASTGLTSANFSETNTAGTATQVVATAGSGQSATVGTAFATNLSATVEDAQGNPVPIAGTSVTFTAPANGASGTFANGTATTTATTNANGVATATVFTANTTAGSYMVTAASTGLTSAPFSETNTAGPGHGYWLVGSDGGIFTFGSAQFYGSTGSLILQRPVVGIATTSSHAGYWLVASDGGIFAFSTGFYGSIPGLGLNPAGSGLPHSLNAPIVGMVPSVTGRGYFMVASDGGVFAFGDAHFAGSCPGIGGCSGRAVAVAPDSTGNGYWLVTNTGNVYGFGDAGYFGAPGPQNSPITSAVATPSGDGYYILDANGQVFAYGDADPSLGGTPPGSAGGFDPATAIFTTSDGGGYWVATALGKVYPFGDAPSDGDMSGTHLNGPIIAASGW